MYSEMKGLPKTGIWIGTYEILYEEIFMIYEKMKESGINVDFHIGEKMGHGFPIYPVEEGAKARDKIIKFFMD